MTDTDTLQPARLCTVCARTELDPTSPLACPSCVYQVRWLVREILDQVVEAHHQYLAAGVSSAAMMVVGPAANYEASSYLHQSATSGRLCRCQTRGLSSCIADIEDDMVCPDAAFVLDDHRDDRLHPATILQAWALTWRRLQAHEQPDPVTIATESRYLLEHLTRLAQHEDAGLPDLITDLQACHGWLDQVLQRGEATVKGEPCPTCRGPRLIRDTKTETWCCTNHACGQTYTDREYVTTVHDLVISNADRLTIDGLAERLNIPAPTLRRWATRQKRTKNGEPYWLDPLIHPIDRDPQGRNLYTVADVDTIARTHRQQARA